MGEVSLAAVEEAIREGHDDLDGMAFYLGVDREPLGTQLAEMREQRLLYRYLDDGVSRHGICGEKRGAA